MRTLTSIDLSAAITFFVGENGTGKSTLLEGVACVAELPTLGAREVAFDETLGAQRQLASDLRLAWSLRTRSGFYLRGEDFFGYLRRGARDDARLLREVLEKHGQLCTPDADGLGGLHVDEQSAATYIARHDSRSHGASFIELFRERVREDGVYLLDEPEGPLSPNRQIELARLFLERSRRGAQFIAATHSPILLACPGARIYSFDHLPIREVAYEDLEQVRVMRDFLADPGRYLG